MDPRCGKRGRFYSLDFLAAAPCVQADVRSRARPLDALKMTSLWKIVREGQSDLRPQIRTGIFGIQLRQLAKKFFGALVSRHRNRHGDFYDFVAPDAFFSS